MPLSWNEIRDRAITFSKEWADESSEDAEAKSFWDAFFNVSGINRRRLASFEEPVKRRADGGKTSTGYIDLFWKGQLIVEHTSRGKSLDKAYAQALDYFPGIPERDLPRYVLVSDFAHFFDLLDKRGTPEAETEHSWTVDFAERKQKAAEEAAPHRREADAQRERATMLREQAKALRKTGKADEAEALQLPIETADKAVRESISKAQAIEDAICDLKAVNPREKKVTDTRTPAQLLEAIAEKGREVEAALAKLRALL